MGLSMALAEPPLWLFSRSLVFGWMMRSCSLDTVAMLWLFHQNVTLSLCLSFPRQIPFQRFRYDMTVFRSSKLNSSWSSSLSCVICSLSCLVFFTFPLSLLSGLPLSSNWCATWLGVTAANLWCCSFFLSWASWWLPRLFCYCGSDQCWRWLSTNVLFDHVFIRCWWYVRDYSFKVRLETIPVCFAVVKSWF